MKTGDGAPAAVAAHVVFTPTLAKHALKCFTCF